ncbi:F-box protein CPR1-like [Trifolium pratense]|uniref:F-box protein CPR1-like n=1 Tax=Trifolium pratense TaxID=57577 RepID=UPI001E695EB7|nr:F-box protein CPR1-like [Trifolium pratense]
MDKLLAATTKKVSNHIYDDPAFVILSKLPLKSLIRFRCVRKSWSVLFQNSYFMDMFRRNFLSKDHSYYNDTSLLLYHFAPWDDGNYEPSALYSLFGERFEKTVKIDWPNLYQVPYYFNIYGSVSVNGIFCIEDIGRVGSIGQGCNIEELGRIALWNPATDECKVIPPSPFPFESPCWDPLIEFHGFGYCQGSDDYKVIRHLTFFPRTDGDREETWKDGYHESLWEIYCLKYNSWRKLDLDMPTQFAGGAGVYTDGVCHWWGESESQNDVEVYLVSFYLNNETFVKTSIPSNMDYIDSAIVFRHLNILNGSIGLISNYAETGTFHISILGEVGIKESWIKLFIVGPLPCVEHPIGIGKKGDIFFRKKDNELVWFNLNTQKIEEIGFKGDSYCQILIYKESFLPFLKE